MAFWYPFFNQLKLFMMKNKIILPLLALCFISPFFLDAQSELPSEKVFMKIEIKGLACPYCAYGMERELKKISGVGNVEIELEEGMAYISTPIAQKPSEKHLKKIVEDAGFTAGEIEFSEKPFQRISKKKRRKGTKADKG